MGKKGFSRKAFLKPTRPNEEEAQESIPTSHAPAPPKEEVVDASEDPSARFLKDAGPSESAAAEASAPTADIAASNPSITLPEPSEGPGPEEESRGQLVQRHKRELKAHKEHAKKLGKKKKNEIEQLEEALTARHKAELEAWEQAHPDDDGGTTSVVAVSTGLYDLKIGDGEEKSAKKPTKAQKRREQRAAEEAERDARIEAEQASQGTSEREAEAEQLHQLLEPLGLGVKDIPADGHCMYRAVQDQLEASNGGEEVQDYAELREETASYLRAFPDEFMPFIVQEDPAGKKAEVQYEEYCEATESTAAWGGQVELQALAQAIERHIIVHCVGLPAVEMGTEYKGKHTPLQVCYLRHAYALGEHYNSVRPLS